MKPFLLWLEEKEKHDIKDALTGLLDLDPQDGLSTPLSSFDPNKLLANLEGLGLWQGLPGTKRNALKARILRQHGTIGDIADEMVGIDSDEQPALLPAPGSERPPI